MLGDRQILLTNLQTKKNIVQYIKAKKHNVQITTRKTFSLKTNL